MLTYSQARSRLGNRQKVKLENNTYLEPLDANTVAVRLHKTNIVLIHANGTYTLNTGGWDSVTTKDRMNRYSPVRLYSENKVWKVGDVGYKDGMVIDGTGAVVSGGLVLQKKKPRQDIELSDERSRKRRLDLLLSPTGAP